jgi:threonine aldolase
MRQAGICAAACLYALDHNVARLAEDHANARALARGLSQVAGLAVETPETNLVFFDTIGTGLTADEVARRVRAMGISVSTVGAYRVRACTHLDVDGAGVALAVEAVADALR